MANLDVWVEGSKSTYVGLVEKVSRLERGGLEIKLLLIMRRSKV
jgi:hypothetical protein